jgi:hypothetical protein
MATLDVDNLGVRGVVEPTGNKNEIARLNDLLGRELGRSPDGKSVFSWRWSEKCLWPGTKTGRMITVEKQVRIPILGAGEEIITMGEVVPEYKIERQLGRIRDAWLICKWLPPWELITGPTSGHLRYGSDMNNKPADEAVEESWKKQYPGMDFPAKGWRVPIGATWDPTNLSRPPDEKDTLGFIAEVRKQTARTFSAAMADYDEGVAFRDTLAQKGIEDVARDAFNAFLNPDPGKRGGFVSFPWTRLDRSR